MLLRGNASPLIETKDKQTAYTFARESGRQLVMNMIAEATVLHALDMENAELAAKAISQGGYVNMRNGAGWTPLMLATAQGNLGKPSLLPFSPCPATDPFSSAVVEELLTAGADANRTENDGWTALHFAASAHADEIVALLIKFNVDPHIRNVAGKTARDIAVENAFDSTAELIPLTTKDL